MTPERLRTLLDAIAGQDPDEQRWAEYELASTHPDDPWPDEDSPLDPWSHRLADLERSA